MADEPATDASPLRRRRRPTSTRADATPTETVAAPATAEPTPEPEQVPADSVADEPSAARSGRRPTTPRFWIGLTAAAIAIGVVVAGIAAFAVHSGKKTYQSQALLEIDQARAVAVSPDDGIVAKLSRLRYKYAGLVRTQVFYGPLADSTGLPLGTVASSVYAVVDPSSLLIGLGARGSNAAQAKTIAAAAADHLVSYAKNEQDGENVPKDAQVTFAIVTPAGNAVKISPSDRRVALVGAGTFAFVVLGTLGFGYLWRRDS